MTPFIDSSSRSILRDSDEPIGRTVVDDRKLAPEVAAGMAAAEDLDAPVDQYRVTRPSVG
jgi:hypothetical protein